ncbi:MAG: substrate-binding domain-containing protein, partial [Peptococcaceae bacterium]|nr:substrate-binding domain-containing protein [Peptococcaceae bacterium]
SVSPVMEKLVEAYAEVNPNVTIEIQTSDSTTGVNSTIEGICDIGMASRGLKDSETGVTATVIAQDGIAVIVNKKCVIDELTTEQIMKIYTGEVTKWDEIK